MDMSVYGAGSDCCRPRGFALGRIMERLDADRSGGLTAAEAATAETGSRLATGFSRIDADGDGIVTRSELKDDYRDYRRDGTPRADEDEGPRPAAPPISEAAPQSLFEALVGAADQDGDLRLSADELAANPLSNLLTPAFADIDTDRDGLLTSREVDAYETPPETPARAPESLYEALVKAADADGDLRLSADEIASTPLSGLLSPAFGQIDTDGDGQLASRELDAFETARNVPPAPSPGPTAPAATEDAAPPAGGPEPSSAGAPGAPEAPDASAGATVPTPPATLAEADAATRPETAGTGATPAATPASATSGPAATYGTGQALSLFESLFQALVAQPGQDTIAIPRDAARDFLRGLAAIA